MGIDTQPAYDAEKIPSERLKEAFLLPPGIDFPPTRSTLLVGARGSGKTMLLRALRHESSYVGLYGDLRKIQYGITADTGAGGLPSDQTKPSMEVLIQNKSMVLLALWITTSYLERDGLQIDFPIQSFSKLLSNAVNSVSLPVSIELSAIRLLTDQISSTYLASFSNRSIETLFIGFLYDFTEQVYKEQRKNLILALDRAEEVHPSCLAPIIRLLDQNHPFIVVVACRPGILSTSSEKNSTLPIAGDHYNVTLLGNDPYSEEWMTFKKKVLESWVPLSIEAIPEDKLNEILLLSRDSIRVALVLVYKSIDSEEGVYKESLSQSEILKLRDSLLLTASGNLRKYINSRDPQSELKSFINKVKRGAKHLPAIVRLKQENKGIKQLNLLDEGLDFEDTTIIGKKIRMGLRTWLFSIPYNTLWHPDSSIDCVELNPIFLWEPDATWGGDR